jgi:predicted RNA polymerase sigma factor
LHAVRAHLLERSGTLQEALAHYQRAAATTSSIPERDYLLGRAERLAHTLSQNAEKT